MEYKACDKIGEGRYSVVYLEEVNGLKVIKKVIKNRSESISELENEMSMLKELEDPSIVIVRESDVVCDKPYIAMEYIKDGDLCRIINRKKEMREAFSAKEIKHYINDLVNGLKHIHSKGVIHRNLTSSNILVGRHDELIFSGLSLCIKSNAEMSKLKSVGSYNYMAPELWLKKPPPYSEKSDIFSLGCILYELYSLKMAFEGNDLDLVKARILFDKKRTKIERMYDERIPEIEKLILRMLEKDPQKRINIEEIEEEMLYWNYCSNSFILNLYLGNGRINYKTLDEIISMGSEKVSIYYGNDDFLRLFFPSVGQKKPQYCKEDAEELQKNKNHFVNNLHKLIDIFPENKNNLTAMIKFLESIKDKEYLMKVKNRLNYYNEKMKNEKSINNENAEYIIMSNFDSNEYINEAKKCISTIKDEKKRKTLEEMFQKINSS